MRNTIQQGGYHHDEIGYAYSLAINVFRRMGMKVLTWSSGDNYEGIPPPACAKKLPRN